MKVGKTVVVTLAALLVGALCSDAFAHGRRGGHHRGHHHHHTPRVVFYATPLYVPRYYYPAAPVYYAPPPAPTTYIEQPQQGYWHYCPQFRAYYPQVQSCPGGWQLVAAQPGH